MSEMLLHNFIFKHDTYSKEYNSVFVIGKKYIIRFKLSTTCLFYRKIVNLIVIGASYVIKRVLNLPQYHCTKSL